MPLTAGESVTYRCATRAAGPVRKAYCVVVLTSNAPAPNQPAFSTFLATTNPAQSAQLCVQPPGAATPACTTYPLSHPTDLGLRDLNVACPASQGPGLYRIAYRLDGVALGSAFDYQAPHIRLGHGPCQSFLGQLKQGPDTAVLHANVKLVNDYSLLSPAIAQWLGLALTPTGAPGSEQVQGIVYADQNGAPGALVAATKPVTIRRTSASTLYPLFFGQALHLSPGTYWLGLLDRRRLRRRWSPRLPNSTLSAGEHQHLRRRPQQPVRADRQRRQRPDDTPPPLPTRALTGRTGVPLLIGPGTRWRLTPQSRHVTPSGHKSRLGSGEDRPRARNVSRRPPATSRPSHPPGNWPLPFRASRKQTSGPGIAAGCPSHQTRPIGTALAPAAAREAPSITADGAASNRHSDLAEELGSRASSTTWAVIPSVGRSFPDAQAERVPQRDR